MSGDVKKLEDYKQEKSAQLQLFEFLIPEEKPYSNTIEFYDAIPKYYWGKLKRDEEGRLKGIRVLEREFKFRGKEYKASITPADIKIKEGIFKQMLPGQREEIVEDVIRKIACNGNGVFLDDMMGATFTLYQIEQELKRIGHKHDKRQIKEAIEVLNKTNLEVWNAEGTAVFSSSYFETRGLVTKEDWKGVGKKTKAFVRFNCLVTESIKKRTFRMINYDKCMSYKSVIARQLHKRISHIYRQASGTRPYNIKLSTLIRDLGLTRYKSISHNIRDVKKALEEMKEQKVLYDYEIQKVLEARKIMDAEITLHPALEFIQAMVKFNKRHKSILSHEKSEQFRKAFEKKHPALASKNQNFD